MNLNKVLLNVAVAVAVSAVTAAGTSYLLYRYGTPYGKAQSSSTQPISPDQARVEQIMRDYLTKNPEILVEMTTELDKRQAAQQAEQQQKTIAENASALFRSTASHTAGNPDGDVTVVEFFDYNCGYCRRALTDVLKLTNDDGKVRLVLKELPIFGEDSEAAARYALAADKQGKYFEMHQKLFSESGKADKEKSLRIAKELGLDMDKLEKDAEGDDVKKALDEARELAQKLNLQGTPLFLIGDRVVPGAPDDLYDQLKAKVVEVREKGCASTC
ncbi:MAG TPA: DsbA family protein [Methyloceanibacter sp.]|nr:DsbA family protein [Methyloceanibacter sp.]